MADHSKTFENRNGMELTKKVYVEDDVACC
jgi:hypothetical protein